MNAAVDTMGPFSAGTLTEVVPQSSPGIHVSKDRDDRAIMDSPWAALES